MSKNLIFDEICILARFHIWIKVLGKNHPHLELVLKGIVGYSHYSLEVEIFECFQANRIFVCYFKASHLCTLAVC